MRRVFRPVAVFSIASGVSLAVALQLLVGARGQGPADFGARSLVPSYELAKLELVDPALYHLSESYVDKSRLDWDAMYDAALDAIERRVPVCMFTREPGGDLVSIEIGEFRTVLEVPTIERRQDLQSELQRIASLLSANLDHEDIPNPAESAQPMALVEYALINGMLSTLDPHSVLLPPDDAREMDVENQGVFGGVGIAIGSDLEGGHLVIDYIMEGKAADRAGLRRNDHIIRIDGESTVNMTLDDAVERLRGPVGAAVIVDVMRDSESKPRQFRIIRELISPKPVVGQVLNGSDIGYVRIEAFHEKVEHRLHGELAELTREAGGTLGGLVLDLRGNPGGFLNQAVKVSDAFLERGDIVSTVDGSGRKTDHQEARPSSQPRYPIVVLVDANSASASEIVAGALRFNDRAVVLGMRTFGKGSVQNLHPMVDNSKLKLTISRYLTPGDRSIQGMGIPADIELIGSVVSDDADDRTIRMFSHERQRREADLDHSLERSELILDDPVYSVRFVRDVSDVGRSGAADVEADFQVQFARDLLKAARGSRRADVLSAAHPVVHRHRKLANAELERRFDVHGLDWANGADTPEAALAIDLRLDLGADGILTAGRAERVALEVTNRSSQPLYRFAAVAVDSDLLAGREEFLFGRIAPGQTARFEQTVELPSGWPEEEAVVHFELRDVADQVIGNWETAVEVESQPLPHLAWRWTMTEASGNGDGIADVGERIAITLDIDNRGAGSTSEPFARLRNRAGKALDPIVAILEPGDLGPVQPPVPDAPDSCETPKQIGCRRVLPAGESWSGAFEVELKSAVDGSYDLELALGDADAYDHASVSRSEFFGWFTQRETLSIKAGEPLPSSEWRVPPTIQITRSPDRVAASRRATISGVVASDAGVKHLMVFAGKDKVFFESSDPPRMLTSVPFTADVELVHGSNVLSVLATGVDGLVTARSTVTWFDDGGLASRDDER